MYMKQKLLALVLTTTMMVGISPIAFKAELVQAAEATHTIVLSSEKSADGTWSHQATIDGETVTNYDYTWHIDPTQTHDEVKNMPAVYHTGTAPSKDDAVYVAHDIAYFPTLDAEDFVRQTYDEEEEWCYYYPTSENADYIFATLPVTGNSVPTDMMHTADEAYDNAVLHITEPGTYNISGTWHGQILVDLGDDAASDPSAKVKLILNGTDVTCDVAAALVFANVYECDTDWETREEATPTVDTTNAGAVVEVADNTENTFSGTNIYRLLKTTFKKDDATPHSGAAQKKYLKIDGAFYSYMTMNINGQTDNSGILNIYSDFEALDSELHLTQNGATINIQSGNDGINTSEDDVSVCTINDGTLNIAAGSTGEGDGIDSNGYVVINGGTVLSSANPRSDSGIDSASGTLINGGTVFATGSGMDWASEGSTQVTMNLQFAQNQSPADALILTNDDNEVAFAYDGEKNSLQQATDEGYRGAIISTSTLTKGATYHLYVGGDVIGDETNGLYDPTSISGYSNEAVQQGYSNTTIGGPGGGMARPDNDFDEIAIDGVTFNDDGSVTITEKGAEALLTLLKERNPNTTVTAEALLACTDKDTLMKLIMQDKPQDGQQPPEGTPDNNHTPPDGTTPPTPPDGNTPPMRPDDSQTATAPTNADFTLTNIINAFSGIDDYQATVFDDVSESDYYYEAVQWAVQNNITHGTSSTTFSPNLACTRAQLVAFLWNAAGSPKTTVTDLPFDDVAANAWYAEAVQWGVNEGLIAGTSATTFSPNDTITRAQTMAFLYRQAGTPDVTQTPYFDDVASDAWYAEAVQWGVSTGVTHGTSSTTFSPNLACTRGQIVTLLHNAQTA